VIRLTFICIMIMILLVPAKSDILLVPEQYHSIQGAINATTIGDTVLCLQGDYYESIEVLHHGIVFGSMFIIDGDTSHISETRIHPSQAVEQRRIIEIIGPLQGAVKIVGLTISGGRTIYTERHWIGGAGIYAREVEIELISNWFSADTADYGAAVRLDSCYSTFVGNVISNNVSLAGQQGGIRSFYGTISLFNNSIRENLGGGVYANRITRAQFQNNEIIDNTGLTVSGGVFLSGNFLPPDEALRCDFIGNRVTGNLAPEGAGLHLVLVDTAIIKDNVFEGNIANHSSGVYGYAGGIQLIQGDSSLIQDNLFLNNYALIRDGAIEIMGSATLIGNQFIGNKGGEVGCLSVNRSGGIDPYVYIERCLFRGNGVWGASSYAPEYSGAIKTENDTYLFIHNSDFMDHSGITIAQNPTNAFADISSNYWSHPSGPYHPTINPSGEGDTVANTHFIPWSTEHFWAANVEPDTNLVEFGLVAEGVTAYSSLLLTNTGVETLIVRGGFLGDPAFSLELGADSLLLASDESAEVLLRFVAQDEEAHLDTLRFDCNDPEAFRETVELRANVTAAIPGGGDPDNLPKKFELAPAQPNPFNPSTLIRIELPTIGRVRVELFNLLGQRVALLHDAPLQAGYHSFTLDGSRLTSGLYLVRASSPVHGTGVQKVLLLK